MECCFMLYYKRAWYKKGEGVCLRFLGVLKFVNKCAFAMVCLSKWGFGWSDKSKKCENQGVWGCALIEEVRLSIFDIDDWLRLYIEGSEVLGDFCESYGKSLNLARK